MPRHRATMLPAACVSGMMVNATAAVMGKKKSPPSQTMSASQTMVRVSVFIENRVQRAGSSDQESSVRRFLRVIFAGYAKKLGMGRSAGGESVCVRCAGAIAAGRESAGSQRQCAGCGEREDADDDC